MTTNYNDQRTTPKFFQKSDFLKIGGTVLITLLVVYIFKPFHPGIPALAKSHSTLISAREFQDLSSQYMRFKPLNIRYVDREGSTDYRYGQLQGFRFSAIQLDSIISHNQVMEGGRSVIPDEVMFVLGQNGTYSHDGMENGNYNLIAIGIKDERLLLPPEDKWSDKKESSIYDKADPCPGPGCPPQPSSRPSDR